MPNVRILIVDDEDGMLEVCRDTLEQLSDAVLVTENKSPAAAERLAQESFDLLITDIRMPGMGGVDLLRVAREYDPNLAALMLTAFPTVETAVECMKLGAADYITKPFRPDDLLATVRALLEGKHLREENRLLRRQIERTYSFGQIIGKSTRMRGIFDDIERISEVNVDVLVVGETGTGKELVARDIHQRSGRKDAPFVPIDCGAIPEELMESEFFGHERGAFTGAQTRSLGLMEFANGGTFFLDEVGQLPLRLQSKLLRALQERRIRRVGSAKEIDIDVRIIAATSLNLEEEVRKERFRLDFYHRIHVAKVEIPPLRERADDVPLLVEHFFSRYAREMERGSVTLSPEAMEVLTGYHWPGNVRELQNVLKRTLAMTRQEVISPEDLPDGILISSGRTQNIESEGFFPLRERRLNTFEKEYFTNLLQAFRGDVTEAARDARLPRGTFYRLLKKHNLDAADFRQ